MRSSSLALLLALTSSAVLALPAPQAVESPSTTQIGSSETASTIFLSSEEATSGGSSFTETIVETISTAGSAIETTRLVSGLSYTGVNPCSGVVIATEVLSSSHGGAGASPSPIYTSVPTTISTIIVSSTSGAPASVETGSAIACPAFTEVFSGVGASSESTFIVGEETSASGVGGAGVTSASSIIITDIESVASGALLTLEGETAFSEAITSIEGEGNTDAFSILSIIATETSLFSEVLGDATVTSGLGAAAAEFTTIGGALGSDGAKFANNIAQTTTSAPSSGAGSIVAPPWVLMGLSAVCGFAAVLA